MEVILRDMMLLLLRLLARSRVGSFLELWSVDGLFASS
jgi:hypothetical protein